MSYAAVGDDKPLPCVYHLTEFLSQEGGVCLRALVRSSLNSLIQLKESPGVLCQKDRGARSSDPG